MILKLILALLIYDAAKITFSFLLALLYKLAPGFKLWMNKQIDKL